MLMIAGCRPQTSLWAMVRVPVSVRSSNLKVSTVGAQLPSGHCMPSFLGVLNCQRPPVRIASPPARPVDGDMCSRQATGRFFFFNDTATTGTHDGQISHDPLSPSCG